MRCLVTLHSNLVIFKLTTACILSLRIILYIPIWLYSNLRPQITGLISILLYIPIWLYSNDLAISSFSNQWLSFTFQSGYIQMEFGGIAPLNSLQLYIPIWLYSNIYSPLKGSIVFFLYIPIWLYSNYGLH